MTAHAPARAARITGTAGKPSPGPPRASTTPNSVTLAGTETSRNTTQTVATLTDQTAYWKLTTAIPAAPRPIRPNADRSNPFPAYILG
ncbi:Mycobacterium numidiamassiliense ORFan [Mycobacterium numidiamassiliense]|uniref:Mycobacterium numidiamassiliense ORFan n=1 Tax=Mycobacterium numidiamassiliense TaxID=1841861 RepID=A0A2U3PH88_9MYCO|nr:Mycobacterium numidiamassiliense ORFan [Mycobacterium numidiamassiliense]